MGRFSWVFRLALVIGAGALLTTAVVVAVAPRVWRIANAHEEIPTDLPDFEPLAQRTYVYDTEGNEIARLRAREQPAGDTRPGAARRHRGVPRRRGQPVLGAQGRQHAQPVPGDAVELRVGRTAAGRVDDHDAGRQERLPGRPRTRRPLQAAADGVRHCGSRSRRHQGTDPRALPQHRVLRQQRLRHRGGRRDLLRQAGRRADVRRSGVPRRPGALAVGVRPDQQPRAQPRPVRPGARPARRRRAAHRGPGDRDRRRLRHPRTGEVDPDPGDETDLLHRGAPRVPPQRVEPARARRTRSATTRCSAAVCEFTRR